MSTIVYNWNKLDNGRRDGCMGWSNAHNEWRNYKYWGWYWEVSNLQYIYKISRYINRSIKLTQIY